jgi:hypothetical protein
MPDNIPLTNLTEVDGTEHDVEQHESLDLRSVTHTNHLYATQFPQRG